MPGDHIGSDTPRLDYCVRRNRVVDVVSACDQLVESPLAAAGRTESGIDLMLRTTQRGCLGCLCRYSNESSCFFEIQLNHVQRLADCSVLLSWLTAGILDLALRANLPFDRLTT